MHTRIRRRLGLTLLLFAASTTPTFGETEVHPAPPRALVEGVHKVLRRVHTGGAVKRQMRPGGNLVRTIFDVDTCPRLVDPYAETWSCFARLTSIFRAGGQNSTATEEVMYRWDAEAGTLAIIAQADTREPVRETSVGIEEDLTGEFTVWVATRRTCGAACAQAFRSVVTTSRVGDRCRASYGVAMTSDVAPVRVHDRALRPAHVKHFACEG